MPRSDYAGSLLFGHRRDNRPEPLDRWRLVSNDKSIRDRLGQVLEASCVQVLLDGADSIRLEMVQWGETGVVHHCDGLRYLSPVERVGDPCGCPPGINERKSCAAIGLGPQPSVRLTFRIAEFPEAGTFVFKSSSWVFLRAAASLKSRLGGSVGETLCDLTIEVVDLKASGGAVLTYFQPMILAA
ncbi:recombination directionality factor [Streptomyces sp. NPDC002285]